MTDHEQDLMEIVGTHGWRALRREAEEFLEMHHAKVYTEAREEFDFIKKEVAAGVIREIRRFLSGIEQKADEIANRTESH